MGTSDSAVPPGPQSAPSQFPHPLVSLAKTLEHGPGSWSLTGHTLVFSWPAGSASRVHPTVTRLHLSVAISTPPGGLVGLPTSLGSSVSSLFTLHPHQWLPRMLRIRLDPERHLGALCDLPWPPPSPGVIRLALLGKLLPQFYFLQHSWLLWVVRP